MVKNKIKLIILIFLIISVLKTSTNAQVEQQKVRQKKVEEKKALSPEKQQAVDRLLTCLEELRTYSEDRIGVALVQANIADIIWPYYPERAREIFVATFESISKPLTEEKKNLPSEDDKERFKLLNRQASTIREVIKLYALHDRKAAEALLKKFNEEEFEKNKTFQPDRSDLLAQLALETARANPQEGLKLGLLSVSGNQIPQNIGGLLFELSRIDRNLSNILFRAVIAAIRRNNFIYTPSLLALTNYVANTQGVAIDGDSSFDTKLLAEMLLDAATFYASLSRDFRSSGGAFIPDDRANFISFLTVRGAAIVNLNLPEQAQYMQSLLPDMIAGLSPSMLQQTNNLSSIQRQNSALSTFYETDIEQQIKLAEQESDRATHDLMMRNIAVKLMYSNYEKALIVTEKLLDPDLRRQTEDDVNLYFVSQQIKQNSYDECLKIAKRFHSVSLRAKILAELARQAFSKEDSVRANEILKEAYDVSLKSDNDANKLLALLIVAEKYSRIDPVVTFGVLSEAVKVINSLNRNKKVDPVIPPVRLQVITAVNGIEMGSDEVEINNLDFRQVRVISRKDYTQTRLVLEKIQDKLLRAKSIIAATRGMLDSQETKIEKKL